MQAKRFSVEQIVAKLREAEKLQAQGMTVAQVCKRIGVSDQTGLSPEFRTVVFRRLGPAGW